MLDPNRRIYSQAPLKLVAFQIRFPQVPSLDNVTPLPAITDALREHYPILGPPPVVEVELTPGMAQQRTRGSRFMNRSRTWSVTLTSEAIAVETSRYLRYELFAEQVEWVLRQVNAIAPLPAVTRLGLRYIDEIDIEGVDELEHWRPWINKDLLVGGLLDGYRTHDYLATVTLGVDALRRMVIRYGRVSQPVVEPNGVLRIDNNPQGPYFLLDIDSFWEPSADKYLEFNTEEVFDVCLELHDPVRDIFERAITPALRERFDAEIPDGAQV